MADREVLERVLEDVIAERNRLRDARGRITRELGLLPASAVVAIGLVATAAEEVARGWLIAAGALVVGMVVMGAVFGELPPYRILRAKKHGGPGCSFAFDRDETDPLSWLERKIDLEEKVCGPLRDEQPYTLTREPDNLQEALDVERTASLVVQLLFAATVVVLVLGIATR